MPFALERKNNKNAATHRPLALVSGSHPHKSWSSGPCNVFLSCYFTKVNYLGIFNCAWSTPPRATRRRIAVLHHCLRPPRWANESWRGGGGGGAGGPPLREARF